MGLGIHNKDIRKALGRVPGKGVARWRTLARIVEVLTEAAKFKLSVDGGDVSEIEGGLHLRLTAEGDGNLGSWWPRAGSGTNTRVITPGVFGGNIMPTLGGIRLDNTVPPELSIFENQETYIYLECVFTPQFEDDFVANLQIDSGAVVVVRSSSPLGHVPAAFTFYVHLATVDANGVAHRFFDSAIDWTYGDTGTNEGLVQVSFFQ